MNGNQIAMTCEVEKVKKMDISLERVAVWTLIFTNAFFVSYFFGKLFALI